MRLGTLFSDGAVLQQGQPVPIWGETLPGLLVEADIAGQQGFARASGDGSFLLSSEYDRQHCRLIFEKEQCGGIIRKIGTRLVSGKNYVIGKA